MVVTTGFFDGVHLGHRLVIEQLVEVARLQKDRSMVITFWPHPRTVLQRYVGDLRLLSSMDEKLVLMKSLGVDKVEVIEFTKDFANLTAEEYLRKYVIEKFGGTTLVLGYDNTVGCKIDSTSVVADKAKKLGLDVVMVNTVGFDNDSTTIVSSTKIRSRLEEGRVEDAAKMLSYDYPLSGIVVEGNHIGRTIGFPTANLQLCEPLKLVPMNGVYLVRVEVLGRKYFGMCNIGVRPTVGKDNIRTIETNIFGFDEDIYGENIRVSFLRKIRMEDRFASLVNLQKQLVKDRNLCKKLIKNL